MHDDAVEELFSKMEVNFTKHRTRLRKPISTEERLYKLC